MIFELILGIIFEVYKNESAVVRSSNEIVFVSSDHGGLKESILDLDHDI